MGVFNHALSERGGQIAAQTFAHELDTTRAVFNYAINLGLILNDPSKDIKRRRIVFQPNQARELWLLAQPPKSEPPETAGR